MNEEQWKEFNERNLLEKEAHHLIEHLCRAQNIELTLKQAGKTGHCEIPEIWTFENPIPVTALDLMSLEQNPVLNFSKTIDERGNIFITEFSRGAGWIVYELESGKEYFT